jgi:hypothetical protein
MLATWDSIPTATIDNLRIQHHNDKENASNQALSKIQKLEG